MLHIPIRPVHSMSGLTLRHARLHRLGSSNGNIYSFLHTLLDHEVDGAVNWKNTRCKVEILSHPLYNHFFDIDEMLHVVEAFIDKRYHPTFYPISAYIKALEDAVVVLDKITMLIDTKDRATMLGLVKSCIGTKFTSQFGDLIVVTISFSQDLAIDATTTVGVDLGQGLQEVDIKKYIKVEKIPGGQLEDSQVLKGVMFNKDVVAPGKMRRKIVNPRIILLDAPLEYKKEEDWGVLLKMEEEYIENLCVKILKFKPGLVITKKGLSDLACHYLSKAGVSTIRRLGKTDNNRIAKACGAVIVNKVDELQESDVKKIGDELFAFIVDCKDPKACMLLLRGASKDLLNEVERNLQDSMSIARNIIKNPKLVPEGGGAELTVSATLKQKSSSIEGIEKWPYEAAAIAFEATPRTLAQNYGVNVIRTMTTLQGKHANGENAWIGIDGNTGAIADMKEQKAQTFETAIEKQPPSAGTPSKPQVETEANADNDKKNVY
ncbi:hypothetical protein UlMin_023477 [Ulmus minor]